MERGGLLGRDAGCVNPELPGLEAQLSRLLGLPPGGLAAEEGEGQEGKSEEGEAARTRAQSDGWAARLERADAPAPARGGSGGGREPFLLYLYALVAAGQGRRAEAVAALAGSLRGCPANWSAWAVRGGRQGAGGGRLGVERHVLKAHQRPPI